MCPHLLIWRVAIFLNGPLLKGASLPGTVPGNKKGDVLPTYLRHRTQQCSSARTMHILLRNPWTVSEEFIYGPCITSGLPV